MFSLFGSSSSDVRKAQNDEQYMEKFIAKNRKFILSTAYKVVGHFVSENDDEWSIALIAFHEAVKSYDEGKGEFYAFAKTVITRRLIDYMRSESKHAPEISVEPEAMGGETERDSEQISPIELQIRKKEAELSERKGEAFGDPASTDIRDEIEAVQQLLKGYGFSFFDLADCSPKSEKTKKACAAAVVYLLQNKELFSKMRSTSALPVKQLVEAGIQKKLLERHRRYIIAAAEILNGEYPLLREYMNYIRKALDP